MNFLSSLALVILTLVGYSSARVLIRFNFQIAPAVLDIICITGLWIGALLTRDELGKWWAILVWMLTGIVVGIIISLIVRDGLPIERPPQITTSFLRRLWEVWKNFSLVMGNFQGRVLLICFYFVIVTPFGLITKITSDPLNLKNNNRKSFWTSLKPKEGQLEDARKQY